MKIAIGSLRRSKIEAVRAAALSIAGLGLPGWETVELIPREAVSDAPETPANDLDLMKGAQNRVEFLIKAYAKEGLKADLYMGLEGGLHVTEYGGQRVAFLRGWVYVSQGEIGAGNFGSSPSIEVPAAIAEAVLDHGESLGSVIDRFSGRTDVRSNEGTWGVLTRDLITRGRSFELAVLAALAPLYNSSIFF